MRVPGRIRYSLYVIGFLLLLNFLLRVVFLFYNFARAQDIPNSYLLRAFLVGFRFDLATIMLFNGVLFLFISLPLKVNRHLRTYRLINIILLLINLPILIINTIDVVYFGFADKRLTHELYSTQTAELFVFDFKDMAIDYGWLLLLFILLSWLFWKVLHHFSHRTVKPDEDFGNAPRYWVLPLFSALVIFLSVRGGTQTEPLSPADAFDLQDPFAGSLGQNSAFTVYFSARGQTEPEPNRVPEKEAAQRVRQLVRNRFDGEFLSDSFPLLREARFDGGENRWNVVILVVESFNALNFGRLDLREKNEHLTPFLDSLSESGMVFRNYFSNGNRSIEFPPAIFFSIPDIFNRPLIGSEQENLHAFGLPHMLAARGYHTSFYHGGKNGTMNFDRFTLEHGFGHYFGYNEYPERERDFDGGWGIYDDRFLAWWAGRLKSATPEPFFSVCFTLSNHHPFFLPDRGTEDIRKLPLSKYRQTTLYTDRSIAGFFHSIQDAPWFNRTIFIITGDHSFHELDDKEETPIRHAQVPCIILAPGLKPGIDNRAASHINLQPTIIELLRLNTRHASAGVSLLDDPEKSFAIYNQVGLFTLVRNGMAWSSNFRTQQPVWEFNGSDWKETRDPEVIPIDRRKQYEADLISLWKIFRDTRMNNRIIDIPE